MTQIPWLDRCINKNRVVHIFRHTPGMSIMGFIGEVVGERLKRDRSQHCTTNAAKSDYAPKDFLDHYLEIQRTNLEVPDWYCASSSPTAKL